MCTPRPPGLTWSTQALSAWHSTQGPSHCPGTSLHGSIMRLWDGLWVQPHAGKTLYVLPSICSRQPPQQGVRPNPSARGQHGLLNQRYLTMHNLQTLTPSCSGSRAQQQDCPTTRKGEAGRLTRCPARLGRCCVWRRGAAGQACPGTRPECGPPPQGTLPPEACATADPPSDGAAPATSQRMWLRPQLSCFIAGAGCAHGELVPVTLTRGQAACLPSAGEAMLEPAAVGLTDQAAAVAKRSARRCIAE